MRLWFILDFPTREHNLMEKFEQNRKKIGAIRQHNEDQEEWN